MITQGTLHLWAILTESDLLEGISLFSICSIVCLLKAQRKTTKLDKKITLYVNATVTVNFTNFMR